MRVTDEDIIKIIDAAYEQPGPDDPLCRIMEEIVEREIRETLNALEMMETVRREVGGER